MVSRQYARSVRFQARSATDSKNGPHDESHALRLRSRTDAAAVRSGLVIYLRGTTAVAPETARLPRRRARRSRDGRKPS